MVRVESSPLSVDLCPVGAVSRTLYVSNSPYRHLIPLLKRRLAIILVERRAGHVRQCLHRVLQSLKLLSPRRRSGGADREEARHQAPAHQGIRRSLRGHPRQRADLLQEADRPLSASRRGRVCPRTESRGRLIREPRALRLSPARWLPSRPGSAHRREAAERSTPSSARPPHPLRRRDGPPPHAGRGAQRPPLCGQPAGAER